MKQIILSLILLTSLFESQSQTQTLFKATHETKYLVTDTGMNTIHSIQRPIHFSLDTRCFYIHHIGNSTYPSYTDTLMIKTLTNCRNPKNKKDEFTKVVTWDSKTILIFEGSHVSVAHRKSKATQTLEMYD